MTSHDLMEIQERPSKDTKTVADIEALMSKAESVLRSDPVRLRELAVAMHESSASIGYERGLAYADFYRGVAARRVSDYDTALQAYEQALAVFNKLDEGAGIRRCLRLIGLLYQTLTQHDKALEYFGRELELWEYTGDNSGIAGTLINIAITYYIITQFDLALEYYFKALDFVAGQEVSGLHANIYVNTASVYMAIREYASALEYQFRSLEIYRQIGDKLGESRTLLNIGWNYFQTQQYEQALEYGRVALQELDLLDDRENKAVALLQIGQVYAKLSVSTTALKLLEQSLELAQEVDNKQVSTDALRFIGDMYRNVGNTDLAKEYYSRSLEIALSIGIRQWQYELHEVLAQVYEELNQPYKSLYHYKQYVAIKDEVQDERRQKSISEMQMRFNVEKTEREKEIYRLKNIELAEALSKVELLNHHLGELNHEKSEMLRIVAHDLKSPLAGVRLVSSLLKDHHSKMEPTDLTKELSQIEQVAATMLNTVHCLLDVNAIESGALSELKPVDVHSVLLPVISSLLRVAANKQIALHYENKAERPVVLGTVEALQQIVTNLVSNAVKFSPCERTVEVRLHQQTGLVRIDVQDEGPGISMDDQEKLFSKFVRLAARPTAGESSTGLGLWIVKKTVSMLKGKLSCVSVVGEGTTFSVELPEYAILEPSKV